MSFERCFEPAPDQLAILNHRANLMAYEREILDHSSYWRDMEDYYQHIGEQESVPMMFAQTMNCVYDQAIPNSFGVHKGWPPSPFVVEANRRLMLSLQGLSHLLMRAVELGDVGEQVTVIIDADLEHNKLPNPHRLHISRAASKALLGAEAGNDEWYLDSEAGLYVHHLTPAKPTKSTVNIMEEHDSLSDLAGLSTLIPYPSTKR